MKRLEPYYFQGDSKNDPGWYWTEDLSKPFANGPYFCCSDALKDSGLTGVIIPEGEPLNDEVGELYGMYLNSKKALTVTDDNPLATKLLGGAGILTLGACWYGIYLMVVRSLHALTN